MARPVNLISEEPQTKGAAIFVDRAPVGRRFAAPLGFLQGCSKPAPRRRRSKNPGEVAMSPLRTTEGCACIFMRIRRRFVFSRTRDDFFIGLRMKAKKSGNRQVEILHIDTVDSQRFFLDHEADNSQKCDCQRALEEVFTQCCRKYGGRVRSPFQGDGGVAFFEAATSRGGAVHAARAFLAELPTLHTRTRSLLPGREVSARHFRIKAHYGWMYFDALHKTEAGHPSVLDALLKYERQIAPLSDQFYITEQLYEALEGKLRPDFVLQEKDVRFGELRTSTYRLRRLPAAYFNQVPIGGKRQSDITPEEWQFLRIALDLQHLLATARNSIAIGLVQQVAKRGRLKKDGSDLNEVTARGIHIFMSSVFSDTNFNVAVWRVDDSSNPKSLQKVYGYPRSNPNRKLNLSNRQFQAVRSFNECTSIVHEDVRASAAKHEWTYFDTQQGRPPRRLCSALQMPIYRNRNAIGRKLDREVLGVLSIDSDCPDFFQNADASLWVDRMRGFLVNFALAQTMQQISRKKGKRHARV